MKKLLSYSDFFICFNCRQTSTKKAQKTLKPLIFNKISGLKIWSSGNFFVTLKVEKQIVMNKIKPNKHNCP